MPLNHYVCSIIYVFGIVKISNVALKMIRFNSDTLSINFYLGSIETNIALLGLCSFFVMIFYYFTNVQARIDPKKLKSRFHLVCFFFNLVTLFQILIILFESRLVARLGITSLVIGTLVFELALITWHRYGIKLQRA